MNIKKLQKNLKMQKDLGFIRNHGYELTEERKRFLCQKFSYEYDFYKRKHTKQISENVARIYEALEENLILPFETPSLSTDNRFFIESQKSNFGNSPAVAIDWVASFVSHMKDVTGLDNPKILQVHGDNAFLSMALEKCSIETIAYQEHTKFPKKLPHNLPYRKSSSAVKKHSDVDAIVIAMPFIRNEHLDFINKNLNKINGKHLFVLCANKPPFPGFSAAENLGQIRKHIITVNNGQKANVFIEKTHCEHFYDLACLSKTI